jgi:uncharacterized protein (TIGR03437 family)
MSRSIARLFVKSSVCLAILTMPARHAAAQAQPTEQQFIDSVNASVASLKASLPPATSPVIFSANLVYAHGWAIGNASTDMLLSYIDGLKKAGAQRIDINPGVTSLSNPRVMQKYDAVVRHIRQLGLQLAINPEYDEGSIQINTFMDFQNVALPAYAQYAARYQPDHFVIVHEPATMMLRMGIQTTVSDWHNFIVAAAPLIKAASPRTRVGAGGYQGTTTAALSNLEAACFQDFVTIPALDFMTMDVYDDDTFPEYTQWVRLARACNKESARQCRARWDSTQWVRLARACNKGIYMEETWAPHYLPAVIPPNTKSLDDIAIIGAASPDFADMDIGWLEAMTMFVSANQMEAITPFTTVAFFSYGVTNHDKVSDPVYSSMVVQAIQKGQLTPTGQGYLQNAQKWGAPMLSSASSASYKTVPNVFNGNFADSIVAPDELVAGFGGHLATTTASAGDFPTSLGGTKVTLTDSANNTYDVPLYSVSPLQINYMVPSAAKPGPAALTVTSGDGVVTTGIVLIDPVAPGLYTANANGQGPAAAIAVTGHTGSTQQSTQFTFNAGCTPGNCVTEPIDLGGENDVVVLELYGTGLRHLSSLSAVTAQINNQNAPVLYAGPQPNYQGLDQVNVQIPRSLAGAGEATLVLTARYTVNVQDSVTNLTVSSNPVTIYIK